MPPPSLDTALATLRAGLTKRDLKDPSVRAKALKILADARGQLASSDDRTGFFEAATLLVDSTARLDSSEVDEVQGLVLRLVRLLAKETADLPPPGATRRDAGQEPGSATPSDVEADPPGPPGSPAAPTGGLRTLNQLALGGIMVELGLIEEADVDLALHEMAQRSLTFGEALVALGRVGPKDVEHALTLQEALVGSGAVSGGVHSPTVHRILLGEILIAQSKLTRTELELGLRRQERTGRRLGEALMALGFVQPEDVSEALAAQGNRALES